MTEWLHFLSFSYFRKPLSIFSSFVFPLLHTTTMTVFGRREATVQWESWVEAYSGRSTGVGLSYHLAMRGQRASFRHRCLHLQRCVLRGDKAVLVKEETHLLPILFLLSQNTIEFFFVFPSREFARWKVNNLALERKDFFSLPLPLAPEFIRNIRLLGRRPNLQQVTENLIKKYGTHFLLSATLGGKQHLDPTILHSLVATPLEIAF